MSEELPDAVNGWRVEASVLHKRRGWDFYRAYNHVLVRYLAAGDVRPFLDLIVNLKRQPRRRAGEFVAAITDGEALIDRIGGLSDLPPIDTRSRLRHCVPKFEICISERRGRGRPKAGPEDAAKRKIRLRLFLGFCALATNKWPREQFWIDLAKALSFNGEKCLDETFPFEAKLVRIGGQMGRWHDPELPMRDKALHAAAAKEIADGQKYVAAVEAVRADVEEQHKARDRGGWAEPSTVPHMTN